MGGLARRETGLKARRVQNGAAMFTEAVVDRAGGCRGLSSPQSGKHSWTSTVALCEDALRVAKERELVSRFSS
jgi:hypothetical protein